MAGASEIGLAAAFAAGAISFLSPCVLPLVPGYVSYVAGQNLALPGAGSSHRGRTLGLSLCFVLGFSTVFVGLGAGANTLSALLRAHLYEVGLASGITVILFGLFTTGLFRLRILEREFRWHGRTPGGNPASAFLLGMAFAFGWTPCIGPVLGTILALAASSASTSGIALLAVYSAGLGMPFVLAAMSMGGFVARLRTLRVAGRVLQVLSGMTMIAMGAAMLTGDLAGLAAWLLDAFPALARIG